MEWRIASEFLFGRLYSKNTSSYVVIPVVVCAAAVERNYDFYGGALKKSISLLIWKGRHSMAFPVFAQAFFECSRLEGRTTVVSNLN